MTLPRTLTASEETYVRSSWANPEISLRTIADRLRVDPKTARSVADRLGLPRKITARHSSQWPAEQLAMVKAEYLAGKSAKTVAQIVNAAFGTRYSRNAIIGKIHRSLPKQERHGRPSLPKNKGGRPKVVREARINVQSIVAAARARETAPELPPEPVLVDVSNAKPWLDRQFGECSWLLGEPSADALCCANPVYKRGWCEGHHRIGTIPSKAPTDKEVTWVVKRWAA